MIRFLNKDYTIKGKLKIFFYFFKNLLKSDIRKGCCNICGKKTLFFGFWSKEETYFCWYCGSNARNRASAYLIKKQLNQELPLKKIKIPNGFKGYITAFYGPVAESLRDKKEFIVSEFFETIDKGNYNKYIKSAGFKCKFYDVKSKMNCIFASTIIVAFND